MRRVHPSAASGRSALVALCMTVLVTPPVLAGKEEIRAGVVYVTNSAQPAEGRVIWQLQELWRVGGDDADILFGLISRVAADDEGSVYLLDQQLSHVHVYSATGEFLRTLGREGEGPGEFRLAWDMLLLPEGKVGIVQTMPAKIILLDRAGHPAGSVFPGGMDSGGIGFGMLDGAQYGAGRLGVVGRELRNVGDQLERVSYLATLDMDGTERVRFMEKTVFDQITVGKYVERDDYFVSHGRWAMGSDGRIYAAPERDAYVIHVYAQDGTLQRIIKRDFEPRKRTPAEKARIGEGMMVLGNGEGMRPEIVAEDYDPCISRLRVAANGELWVLSARGKDDRAGGILHTYDVFDAQGHYVRQVAIAGEADADNDRLVFLDPGRVALIKGFMDSARSMTGSGDGGGENDELEVVICTLVEA